jgi:hypothetical protein
MNDAGRDAAKLLEACGNEVKKLPDGPMPGGDGFHVCSARRHSWRDSVAECFHCGCPVFFVEPYPGVPKICIHCTLLLTSGRKVEGYASGKTLDKFAEFIRARANEKSN